LKVLSCKLGVDKEGRPVVICVCSAGVYEEKLSFGVGFGILEADGNYYFIAFKDSPQNILAVIKNRDNAIEFIKKLLEHKGFKWINEYHSEIEPELPGGYSFFVPFTQDGWTQIDKKTEETLQKMLKLLEGNGKEASKLYTI